jgi:hypothetical protein
MKEIFALLKKLLERTAIALTLIGVMLLLISAAGGLTVGAFSLPLTDIFWRVIVITVGIILIGFGIVFVLRETQKAKQKDTGIETAPLIGREAIYQEANRLLIRCCGEEVIRATSLGRYSDEEGEEELAEWFSYVETLASKIGEAKQKKLDMVYKVVMGFKPDKGGVPPSDKQRGIITRRNKFKEKNALDRIYIWSIDTSYSLDVLIVGNSNMIIGFPTVAGRRELTLGIRLTNDDFVGKVCRWFDDFVLAAAQPVTWTGEESKNEPNKH